ncbi:MAG: amidohydrolase [Thermotaleaceae bacterium]
MDRIKELVEKVYPQVVAWRRDFHMYPELSGEEEETAKKIVKILKEFPLEITEGVGGHGVVAVLKGDMEGKTLALRADMDALPIQEQNVHDFASRYEGKMHACGHDGHTAMLLGTAAILSELKEEICGNIKFIFQPAEEKAPIGGAKPMIEAGVLENPHVDGILGLHIWPGLPKGAIGLKEGALMASSDPFTIEIHGKSGHAAAPHQAIDALVVGCQVVNMLQTIVSRNVDPLASAVVTVGTIKSGTKYNVISDYTKIEGTVRTLNKEVQRTVEGKLRDVVDGICISTGTKGVIKYQRGYPALINDPYMVNILKEVGELVTDKENLIKVEKPAMGGEDFANYLQKIPGAFFWLGGGEDSPYPIHHPQFDFDEQIMRVGMDMMAHAALHYLRKGQNHE